MRIVDAEAIAGMKADAAQVARRRTHATLHDDLSDPIQRVVIALQPGTYVRPHRHGPGVWELFTLLDGALAVLSFDDGGTLLHRVELRPGGARMAQLPPGTWHTVVALAPDTLTLEIKPGPYRPTSDKDFAAWAPAEGQDGTANLLRWLETAAPGMAPPAG